MKKFVSVLLIIFLSASLPGCGINTFQSSEKVFSSGIIFAYKGYGGNPKGAYSEMIAYLGKLDKLINPKKAESDVARINSADGGQEIRVDAETYKLIYEAKNLYTLTEGAFNIAVYPLSKLWNVDADGINKYQPKAFTPPEEYIYPEKLPTPEQIALTLAVTDLSGIEIQNKDGKYTVKKQLKESMIELGGIAKGYAADKLRDIAEKYNLTSARIDVSGNLYLYGKYYREADKKLLDWTIGVNSPRPRFELLGRNSICAFSESGDISVVTSGDYERFYCYSYGGYEEADFIYIPHIIDGSTGLPIGVAYDEQSGKYYNTTVISSATVIGGSSMVCDALTTAISVFGIEAMQERLEKFDVKAIVFEESNIKRMALCGDVEFYKPDKYNGFKEYARV